MKRIFHFAPPSYTESFSRWPPESHDEFNSLKRRTLKLWDVCKLDSKYLAIISPRSFVPKPTSLIPYTLVTVPFIVVHRFGFSNVDTTIDATHVYTQQHTASLTFVYWPPHPIPLLSLDNRYYPSKYFVIYNDETQTNEEQFNLNMIFDMKYNAAQRTVNPYHHMYIHYRNTEPEFSESKIEST